MIFPCPICYSTLSESPYDEFECASFEICHFCHTQFGYDDANTTHEELRNRWLNRSHRVTMAEYDATREDCRKKMVDGVRLIITDDAGNVMLEMHRPIRSPEETAMINAKIDAEFMALPDVGETLRPPAWTDFGDFDEEGTSGSGL